MIRIWLVLMLLASPAAWARMRFSTLSATAGGAKLAQAVGANVRGATNDLGQLRGEVEANLRKVESMIDEINRRWPFARDAQGGEVKLP